MNGQVASLAGRRHAVASRTRAVGGMLVFTVLWAVIELVGTVGIHRVSAWQVVCTRYAVHLAIVLVVWGRHAPWRTRRLRTQLVRSAMMLVMPASFVIALSRGAPTSWVMTAFWSAPLQLLVFAVVLEHEHPRMSTWIAAALGWIAAWVYYAPDGAPPRSGLALGLIMAASLAVYVVMTRTLRDEPLRTNLFYTAVVPFVGLLGVVPTAWITPSPSELAALVFIGAAGLVALLAVDRATDAAPASSIAPLLHAQIGMTALIALLANHHPGARRLGLTALLLVATVVLASIGFARSRAEEIA
jgi:drug/metabolite transporter (DMT)-like permease